MSPRLIRRVRRWLAWIHHTDRVRYWRSAARDARRAEASARQQLAFARGHVRQYRAELEALHASAEATGADLYRANARAAELERANAELLADLESARQLADGQQKAIAGISAELAASGALAEMTPAARARAERSQRVQEAALRTLDPARAGGAL